MNHIAHIRLSKDKLAASGITLEDKGDHFEFSFRQDERKTEALYDAGARLSDAGFRDRSIDQFLDELVAFESTFDMLLHRT